MPDYNILYDAIYIITWVELSYNQCIAALPYGSVQEGVKWDLDVSEQEGVKWDLNPT